MAQWFEDEKERGREGDMVKSSFLESPNESASSDSSKRKECFSLV